jgi:ABC-type transport system substrate-binding protein/PKD repeat protein
MQESIGRATRTTVIAALFFVVLMLGVPSFFTSGHLNGAVGDAAASGPGNRVLRIGWIEFQSSVSTLNPLLYTMAEEMMLIWPCYSTLMTRDVDGNLVGDLAQSWSLSPDGLTYNFKLTHNAKFYDKNNPTADHPVTAADVIYTYWLVQNSSGNYLQSYFPVLNGKPILERMWNTTGDPYDLYIKTSSTYAPMWGAMSSIPILPKYLWSTQKWDWANYDVHSHIAPCIGSGPFYYGMDALPSSGTADLMRSPTWSATQDYGWQLHVNQLTFKTELSPDTSYSDYINGAIDVMMEVSPQQYLNASLPGNKFAKSTGFVYEFNLNQMSDALRKSLGGSYSAGSNNQLLLDPVVKRAMAMCVDKQGFVDGVLSGLGLPADSLVPDASPWHYWYGLQPGEDPNRVGRAPVGEEPIPYDPAGARALLVANGWAYDLAGNPAGPTTYPLCKAGGTDPLRFRYWTLNTDQIWDLGARQIANTEKLGGIDLLTLYSVQTTTFMNNAWSQADYDTWLWDWMFSPTSDPSTDIMQVLTTEAIGSWSDVYWSNATYDKIYYESLQETDPASRMVLTDELQRMAYENMGCQLVAYRKELYAASSLGPDHWQNYGDWTQKWTLMPDQLYPYLYMQLEPADNPAPVITGFQTSYETDTLTPVTMTGSATDAQPLLYRWFFGDGTRTDWLTSPGVTHTYTKDGYYTAWFAVKENSGLDGFVTVRKATVKVIDTTNTPPHDLAFTYEPSDPDSGTIVYLNGTAIDDQGDTMAFTWNFGDGTTAKGQRVTHQFAKGDPSYTVTMSVDDGHLGLTPRPVNYSRLIAVAPNSPPSITVYDEPTVQKGVAWTFTETASDPNSRDVLRFTWNWGDGKISVTSTPTAIHTYGIKGLYTLTVFADDQTGLAGHNVSDTGLVNVVQLGNHAPVIVQFNASNQNPFTDEVVTFYANATDWDNDPCRLTFDFGDGNTSVVWQSVANTTVSTTHAYTTAGFYVATVVAWDGQTNNTVAVTPLFIAVVQGNRAPTVGPLPEIFRTTGDDITFTATATDPDAGDTLNYTWDFGDGSPMEVGQTVHHIYTSPNVAGYAYRVYVDDGQGHNVSDVAIAHIDSVPVLTPLTDMTVDAVIANTFTATAADEDFDTLTYTWDFGDGTGLHVGGPSIDHAFAQVATPTVYTYTVWVDDGFVDDMGHIHNVTSSASVTVTPHDDVPPVANAGPDQVISTVDPTVTVYFDGTGSSDNVGIVSYTWTFTYAGNPVTLIGATPSFDFSISGVYDVTLTVADAAGNTATDTVQITVTVNIPEFPMLVVPVSGLLVLFVVAEFVRRRKE